MRRGVTLYRNAPDWAKETGIAWYPQAQESILALARSTDHPFERAARVVAAMSPRCTWEGSLTKAKRALESEDLCEVRDMPSVMGNLRKVCRGEEFGKGSPKVSAFARNLLGDEQAVTVDSWMSRAFGGKDSFGIGWYRQVEGEVSKAAVRVGLTPRTMQAILWVAQRGR